jgi:two-component system cell cycle response regulator
MFVAGGAHVASILLIDDSETHRTEIRAAVDAAGLFDRVLEASDGLKGLRLLLAEPVDLVLCDLEMPGLDGEKLLRVKAQSPGGANIPFLFLTANTDIARRARLLEDGASDAITKPFHPADLVARLGLHLKIKRLQDELMVKNATLARLSTVDALTGLRSRRYAMEFLSVEFLRVRRYHTPLTLIMADLDHFKDVNDSFGHPAGDAVLRGVSEILLSAIRATDMGARYGGEEFLVVMPQNDAEGARILGERWRETVENQAFVAPDGRLISVTISVGVAAYAEGLETPEDLLAAADRALYAAKQAGRNRVVVDRGGSST